MITSNMQDVKAVLESNNIKLFEFDLSAFYSIGDSQMNFNQFKSEIKNHSLWLGDRQTDYLIIFADAETMGQKHFKVSHLKKMRKQALYDLAESLQLMDCDIKDYTKADIITELLSLDGEDYYKRYFQETSYNNLEYDFSITGYSQGDKVLIKLVGKVEPYIDADFLTNMFYDCPVYGYIEIRLNGEEFTQINFNELEDFNEYDFYDRDKVLKLLKSQIDGEEYAPLLVEYLESELPKSLDYK